MAEEADGVGLTDQLDSVLSNLYDFGEDFVFAKKKAKKSTENQGLSKTKEPGKQNGLKNKPLEPTACLKRKKKNASHFFESIKDELCNQTKTTEMSSEGSCGDAGSKQTQHSVEVVTFVSRRDKKKTFVEADQEKMPEDELDAKVKEESNNTFNFEKARLEVHKFGITGYKKEKQRTFERERAIMLGAKAPKKEYLNYKVFQEKIKEKREKQKKKKADRFKDPTKKKRKQGQTEKRTKKTKSSGRIVPTGHVGKFKDGALILSTVDIKKIQQSKVIK
ncbi:LOW QUALITY PROTEIN: uncharacterized protein C1orf131 homolog [Bombina bombina]|uniref:LOW QUALITY PROTEIN: uncharacterized protein C1orf131 homolog n=1 Tax=Bombina bombina TaxID=8345 RepID=UPI00235AC582|nr:LOW QUALITY PROTEIN: uncharacterized protein C1orf131 homolog [Bombina bombina]